MGTVMGTSVKMFQILYGSTAAGLHGQAAKLNAQARTLYLQSSDTYYKANDAAAYDDWNLAVLFTYLPRGHSATSSKVSGRSKLSIWPRSRIEPSRSCSTTPTSNVP